MLGWLWRFFCGNRENGRMAGKPPAPDKEFLLLNELAPIKDSDAAESSGAGRAGVQSGAADPGESAGAGETLHSFVCREAVLNRAQRVAGYEFTLRKSTRNRIRHAGEAVLRLYDEVLVRNLISMQIERLLGERLAFVGVTASSLKLRLFDALPKDDVVLLIHSVRELGERSGEILERARHLRRAGYRIALDEFNDSPELEPFLAIADFVVIDVSAGDIPRIGRQVFTATARFENKLLVAKNIESVDDFEACHKLPFHYFQGPFVTRREKWDQPALDGSRIKLCELLNQVKRNAELPKLASGFRQDPVLSYKLLRYINSPAGGLLKKLTSIEQALVVLGQQKLYRWLTFLLFNSHEVRERDLALMENALVRARLAELLGSGEFSPDELDELFVVGMFSLLDVLFRMPMADALAQLNLPEAVVGALASGEGRYAPYLELAIACEEFDQEKIAVLAAACRLDVNRVNACHIEALIWAQEAEK
ncbi:MAG: HDOD domain-containing protein [Pseudomonadota bacterium]